jgi:predicted nucleic acid-binding protein
VTRIFWDTNLFIYLLEGGRFAPRVRDLRKRMAERGDELFTSALTLGELLVKPTEAGEAASRDHRASLEQAATIVPFDTEAAVHYASIRADRTIKPPDAIQLACAAAANIDLFITNDDRLSSKVVSGVKFVTSLDRAYL